MINRKLSFGPPCHMFLRSHKLFSECSNVHAVKCKAKVWICSPRCVPHVVWHWWWRLIFGTEMISVVWNLEWWKMAWNKKSDFFWSRLAGETHLTHIAHFALILGFRVLIYFWFQPHVSHHTPLSLQVECVAISPDGHHVISGSADKTLRMWDITTGSCIRVMEGHTHWVR